MTNKTFIISTSLIVALGGFLLGFDASVISGVVPFIESYFVLNKLQLGWSVSCLTLASTLAMMIAGPLSDRFGRRKVLIYAAVLFTVSAFTSAIATTFWFFVVARMIGGFGVGLALLIAPMYIAEISPPRMRGSMVSLNQFTIVFGISVAYFSNYFLLKTGVNNWRWMLGVETIPAVLYFIFLFFVPESPRWMAMKGKTEKALDTLIKANGEEEGRSEFSNINESLAADTRKEKVSLMELFSPAMRLVMTLALAIAFFQQATGINAILYYAPMIFEQTGLGRDASFAQAIIVGLTNFTFTFIAIWLIDKLGRKPLLLAGLSGMAIFLFLLAFGFKAATYTLDDKGFANAQKLVQDNPRQKIAVIQLERIKNKTFTNDIAFKKALRTIVGKEQAAVLENILIANSIAINGWFILIAIIGFVASFAMAIGPIIWVLLSELFPNRLRGRAISFAGFVNSVVAFIVVLIFPWQINTLGNFGTFFIFGVLAIIALAFVYIKLPETKGKSLEEIEKVLVQ